MIADGRWQALVHWRAATGPVCARGRHRVWLTVPGAAYDHARRSDARIAWVKLREANEHDLHGVLALYRELHPDDPALDEDLARRIFARMRIADGLHVFVAEVDGALAGTCYLNIIPNLTRNGAPYAIVENVVTTGRLRRSGIGRAVLSHALEFAWDTGCYKVMLQTGSRTPGTHAFYRACGFTDTEKVGYLARPPASALPA
jgi:GNAT superfamily N-acetyltransferase